MVLFKLQNNASKAKHANIRYEIQIHGVRIGRKALEQNEKYKKTNNNNNNMVRTEQPNNNKT